MALEIERKFLVLNDAWRALAGNGLVMRQGYLSLDPERVVRVRLAGDKGFLTIKGMASGGIGREEFEYSIPAADAEALLAGPVLRPLVEKTRYRVPCGGLVWEVDEFSGHNQGLVVAELELESEDQAFERPPWLGREVTREARYANASLVREPYCRW